jgi:hypothetical protein
VSEKILIEAGRSVRGWSRIGNFFKCPQLFAYDSRLDIDLIPASALTRGSMGHVMQAHQHAIWGARNPQGVWVDDKWYDDPDVFLSPEDALTEWCDQNRAGHVHIDRMVETFRNYLGRHPEPPGSVLMVEYPVTAVLGEKDGQWGLWVVALEDAEFNRSQREVMAWDGQVINITPLNVPGHEDHDKAIVLTRRLDMVTMDRSNRVFIWDHKHQAMVKLGTSVSGYAIDGGFAAFRIMGKQMWPNNFGGVALNLIQTQEPWRVARPSVPATPHRDAHFAQMLWRAEHQMARLDLECPDFWDWPKAQSETSCVGRYGKCAALNLCFYGPSAQTP